MWGGGGGFSDISIKQDSNRTTSLLFYDLLYNCKLVGEQFCHLEYLIPDKSNTPCPFISFFMFLLWIQQLIIREYGFTIQIKELIVCSNFK